MAARGILRTLVAILPAVPILGWVAWWNGFPTVFADTAAYLHGVPPRFRSALYALFLRTVVGQRPIEHAVVVQAAVAAYCVWVTVRALELRAPLRTHAALVVTLALVSTLPWFVAFLMPDVFAGMIPLLVFALTRPAGRLHGGELLLLVVLEAAAVSFHGSYFPLYVGLAMLAGTSAFLGTGRRTVRPIALLALPALLAATAGLWANWTIFHRAAVLPAGNCFTLARLLADGSAKRYLADVCPRDPYALCPYLGQLADDSGALLWRPGPFRALGYLDALRDVESARIIAGTLRTQPFAVATASLQHTGRLLVRTDLDEVTQSWRAFPALDGAISARRRSELATYQASRQSRDVLRGDAPKAVIRWTAVACLVIVVVRVARRRGRGDELAALLGLALAGLAANAVITASLAGPASRYHTRMLWLLPLLAGCCVAEWLAHRATRRAQVRG